MPISAGISAGGSLLGGVFGSKGSKSAASQQSAAAQKVLQLAQTATQGAQQGVQGATTSGQAGIAGGVTGANQQLTNTANQVQSLYAPYTQAGSQALGSLQQLSSASGPLSQQFSFNPSNLQSDPGYQFTLQQGQQAIDRSAAATGSLNSTGTLKSLANYTTGTANQYFNDAYNRAQSTFNTNRQGTLAQISAQQGIAGLGSAATQGSAGALTNLGSQGANTTYQGGVQGANLGLQGATTSGQFGLQGAQIAGNALTNMGNAQAAGTIGAANAWSGALGGGVNAINGYLNSQNYGGMAGYPTSPSNTTSETNDPGLFQIPDIASGDPSFGGV